MWSSGTCWRVSSGPYTTRSPCSQAIAGVLAYPDIESLPLSPISPSSVHPARTGTAIIEELGKKGTGAAIILAAQFSTDERLRVQASVPAIRHPAALGPNSMGILLPGQGINASFSPLQRLRDRWRFSPSRQRSAPPSWIGPNSAKSALSAFISLGIIATSTFGQLLDQLLGRDDPRHRSAWTSCAMPGTLSAARAASPTNPS